MVDDGTGSKKKITPGQYTHWARPKWIRMYSYNFEYGESYYRPQVRYMSTTKYKASSEIDYSSNYSHVDVRKAYQERRHAMAPPRAQSFIERWSAEPFYGRGFSSSRYSSSRDYSAQSSRRMESAEREVSSSSATMTQETRSRRAQSEMNSTRASSYASSALLQQINHARATSVALQEESAQVQQRLMQRRARSVEALRRVEMDYVAATHGSDDCLMRSDAMDSARRTRREQSVQRDIQQRWSREGSVARNTQMDESTINFDYPSHHLVCSQKCPLYTDPEHHRRFLIGNRFNDAAALGGFDVLYDPTVYKNTRKLLTRLSEERDVESTVYESTRESSAERAQSRSRLAYRTIY